jgi:hypothetical protein
MWRLPIDRRVVSWIGHLLGGYGAFCVLCPFLRDVPAEGLLLLRRVILIAAVSPTR